MRISPQKARLVVDMIRGKKVDNALNILNFSPTKGAEIVKKVVVTSSQHRKRLLKHYKNIEKDIRRKKSKIILYGASNFALEFLKNTNLNNNILFLTDSNSIYHYKKRFGHKVLPPSDIVNINFDKSIVTSGALSSYIKNEIIKLGIKINRIIQL